MIFKSSWQGYKTNFFNTLHWSMNVLRSKRKVFVKRFQSFQFFRSSLCFKMIMPNILFGHREISICETTHATGVRNFLSRKRVYGCRKAHVTIVRLIFEALFLKLLAVILLSLLNTAQYCFCRMLDWRKALSLISSLGHCRRFSPM